DAVARVPQARREPVLPRPLPPQLRRVRARRRPAPAGRVYDAGRLGRAAGAGSPRPGGSGSGGGSAGGSGSGGGSAGGSGGGSVGVGGLRLRRRSRRRGLDA